MTTKTDTLHFVRTGRDFVVVSEPVGRLGIGEVSYDVAKRVAAKASERTGKPVRDLSGR